jgi:hypothetical protein
MVSYLMLTKLAKAEERAAELGLERTAGRLGSLRKHLEGFKHLSDGEMEKRAYWAIAKVEDAKSCLLQEMHASKEARDGHESDAKTLAILTKGGVYAGALVLAARMYEAMAPESADEPSAFLPAAAALAVAVFALTKIINRVLGTNRFDETVRFVERMLDECRRGLLSYSDD